MARSAALNPASMPFFPGSLRSDDDEGSNGGGFSQHIFRDQDRSSISSHSISPSDYRSVRSSPSPPQTRPQDFRQQSSPSPRDISRQSPTFRQNDPGKPYPGIETRTAREGSMLGSLGTLPEGDDSPTSLDLDKSADPASGTVTPNFNPAFALQQQHQLQQLQQSRSQAIRERERASTPSFAPSVASSSLSGPPYGSASPVSSQDSNSRFTPSVDHQMPTLEAQLKASPMIHDILDRLVRCEFTQREIQRDLADINRKVNILVDKAINSSNIPPNNSATPIGQPEFNDPFATNGNTTLPPNSRARASITNIAPNQSASADDISSISQRLNTLTSSVGQLLALQTQQLQQQNALADSRNNSIIGLHNPQMDIAPNALGPTASSIGHVSGRHDLRGPTSRQPPQPGRTWSVGNLDLPVRPNEHGGRAGDKRRSVMVRRDSAGVDALDWPGGAPRDNGPLISKWEQLSLAPELLRSLTKFGVGPPNKIQQRALPFLLKGADIIAQAPPTQERIAAYVIPAIQVAVTNLGNIRLPMRGPIVILLSTTVDQATQAHRMIRDLGGPINVRSALGVGTTTASTELASEIRTLQQNMPHIICGTPQKLHALFTTPGGLSGSEVRFLVLDEVDQLIARNLHEFVFTIVKALPPPRSRPLPGNGPGPSALSSTPSTSSQAGTPGSTSFASPFDSTSSIVSPFQNTGRRFSAITTSSSALDLQSPTTPTPIGGNSTSPPNVPGTGAVPNNGSAGVGAGNSGGGGIIERQTALFSNTVPQDVLNLASAIQLREPVRVLVRRDGNVSNPDTSQQTRGLRQFYLYLAFTAGGRSDPSAVNPGGGLGIIGSGRSATSAETTQAREWKLDALADILEDVEVNQAIVHVGGMNALEAVAYKLATRGYEAVPLHGDMNTTTKAAALNKFRNPSSVGLRGPATKVLVVYDVQIKNTDVPHVPLVINYDLPKAVEEYSHRVAPAIASTYSRAGVVVNFVTATGGDVEMLRSIECFYKIKCPEVPPNLRDIV